MDPCRRPGNPGRNRRDRRRQPGVRGFHDLKTRTAGSRVFVNLHIELDGEQTLREAHEIGASLRRGNPGRLPAGRR